MKKIFILFSFIVLSITPTFAETMAVQAVTEISTTKPNEIIKVKVIRCEIDNAKTKKKTKDDMVKTIMKIIKDEVRKSMK